jgi:hypothetical protein
MTLTTIAAIASLIAGGIGAWMKVRKNKKASVPKK